MINKVKIASLGGIEAILAAMSAHKDHIEVQEQACGALASLAADNDGIISMQALFLRFFYSFSLISLLVRLCCHSFDL